MNNFYISLTSMDDVAFSVKEVQAVQELPNYFLHYMERESLLIEFDHLEL